MKELFYKDISLINTSLVCNTGTTLVNGASLLVALAFPVYGSLAFIAGSIADIGINMRLTN